MKYLSSILMVLLFCMPCLAMQSDPLSLESILSPPKGEHRPLSLQFMLNPSEPEDDQSDHNNLAIPPMNGNMPQDDNHPIQNRPAGPRRTYQRKQIKEDGQMGYQCPHCSQMYTNSTSRNNHVRFCRTARALGILKDKKVKCSLCPYMCSYPSQLTMHMVTHSNARSYECYCFRTFNRISNFRSHASACSQYQDAIANQTNNNQNADNMIDYDHDEDNDVA